MRIIRGLLSGSEVGLVIKWKFHQQNGWVSAFSKFLTNAIIEAFNPIIITSQLEYNLFKNKVKYLISMEPGWAAPELKYDSTVECIKVVFYSDPHYKTEKRFKYFMENGFNYVLSFYHEPFFYHFKNFPVEKFVHFPWAVPDQFLNKEKLEVKMKGKIAIFGGKGSAAYDMRNWCREQVEITNFNNSGVENKIMSDEEYYQWLRNFDAIVAAGSTDPKYNLVTPKYFEILSAGALLIGQYCQDFEHLKINHQNALIFNSKSEFKEKIRQYKSQPEEYIEIREKGRHFIKDQHLISHRIQLIKNIFYAE